MVIGGSIVRSPLATKVTTPADMRVGRKAVAFTTIVCQNACHQIAASTLEREVRLMETPVKMYTLSTCSHCKATKKLLEECAVKYEFTDVDLLDGNERAAILEDIRKLNPRCSFPTIIIGDKIIVGYQEEQIKEALGL